VGDSLDLRGPASRAAEAGDAMAPDGAYTVLQITRRACQLVESGFHGSVWVRGEVTGLKQYRSGHWYFSLRDRFAQVRCVMWSKDNRRLPAPPTEGLEVFINARPTVWEDRGEFRLTVTELLPSAADGLWQLRLEQARAALEKDGLFDRSRKRALPPFPERMAVVTSPDGDALRDILTLARRRWPLAEVYVVPTRVQGEGAEDQICWALSVVARIHARRPLDVAIVGRGGGSKEDLWTFNSERVCRAVASMPVPVVSAIGHEADVSLCDLVADLRAPTPSAAVEAATPDRDQVMELLRHLGQRLSRDLKGRATWGSERLERMSDRLTHAVDARLDELGSQLRAQTARLDALSPLKVLARGYAVARDESGQVLKRVQQFPDGKDFRLRVTDGEIAARVLGPGSEGE
jgi:exodeoxyribonuclease VII large subunit